MKIKIFLITISFSLFVNCYALYCTINTQKFISCSNSKPLIDDSSAIAWAIYENNVNLTGWANLELHTSDEYNDGQQAYYAGYLEGYVTHELIGPHFRTKLGDVMTDTAYVARINKFLAANRNFTRDKIQSFAEGDPYWHQIDLIYNQLQGLQEGYDKVNGSDGTNVFLLNLRCELDDISNGITYESQHEIGEGSCSALIKPLPDGSDLFVAHNTWASFTSMLRMVKKYSFQFHTLPNSNSSLIAGHSIAQSSFPGVIFSIDDFYVISSGLAVMETTIENFNNELWKYVRPETVLEFMRNIAANRLSATAYEWVKLFAQFNSGTYNNQFMIIDYNKFKKGTAVQSLPNGLVWIIEQLPGMAAVADVTEVIRSEGYWASYNIAYFDRIRNASGYPSMVSKYGDHFTWNHTARANIFRRDHSKVTDINSVYHLMRYNDYKNDPLSRCNCTPPYSAMLSIAARGDLNDPNGKYPLRSMSHVPQAAIDAKVTNAQMIKELQFIAVSGPTNDNQTSFQYSMSDFKSIKHYAQPDVWNFSPIHVQWSPLRWTTVTL